MNTLIRVAFIVVVSSTLSLEWCSAQQAFSVAPSLRIPLDSARKTALFSTLERFMEQISDRKSTTIEMDTNDWANRLLLDELYGIQASKKYGSENFYKAQLINVAHRLDSALQLQISFVGVRDSVAILRALVTLHAKEDVRNATEPVYHLSAALDPQLQKWNTKTFANTCFHFQNSLNEAAAAEYVRNIHDFDLLLEAPRLDVDVYCFDDISSALSAFGINALSDAAGFTHASCSTIQSNHEQIFTANSSAHFAEVDPHDLWHSRLRRVEDMKLVNRPVDEGCAFLYGGSWGLSWTAIRDSFMLWRTAHPHADWLSEYENNADISTKAHAPLNMAYILNAFVVQELQRTKGFGAVRQLLRCGPLEKGNANYFAALHSVCGVDKDHFSEWLEKLILQSP